MSFLDCCDKQYTFLHDILHSLSELNDDNKDKRFPVYCNRKDDPDDLHISLVEVTLTECVNIA